MKWLNIILGTLLVSTVLIYSLGRSTSNGSNVIVNSQVAENDVVLYATSWCGYCAKTRKMLNEKGIEFVEFDVEKSGEGRAQYELIGIKGVPVLNVNGTIVQGYNPSKIIALLN